MNKKILFVFFLLLLVSVSLFSNGFSLFEKSNFNLSIWFWIITLFIYCFILGILSVLAGVGGGVLFVPFVSALFPFHMDFVRGASLFATLAGTISSTPEVMKKGLAPLRLVFPIAIMVSISAIIGAKIGLMLPDKIIRILLGIIIFMICIIMILTKKIDNSSNIIGGDYISNLLSLKGIFYDDSLNKHIEWKASRTLITISIFIVIGFIAGMFGLGAGWANVPVLNLIMGLPLKVSVGSSLFIISIGNTSPALVYLSSGSILPIITIPAVMGMYLGSRIGIKFLKKTKPVFIKHLVILLLFLSSLLSILKGFGIV